MRLGTKRNPVADAVAAVTSRTCRCGRPKYLGSGLCAICWRVLPQPLQRRVYTRGGIDSGALAEAFRVLDFRARTKYAVRAAGKEGDAQDDHEARDSAPSASTGCR